MCPNKGWIVVAARVEPVGRGHQPTLVRQGGYIGAAPESSVANGAARKAPAAKRQVRLVAGS